MSTFGEVLDKLIDERAREVKTFREFVDPLNAEGRSWTAEEQQEYGRRNAVLDDFDQRIRDAKNRVEGDRMVDEYQAEAEGRMHKPRENAVLSPEGQAERDFLAFVKGEEGAPKHYDVSLRGLQVTRDIGSHRNKVVESRSESVGTYTAGGALLPVSFRAVLYQYLILNSAVLQTRATQMVTSGGEHLLMPKVTAHPATGTLVSEGAAIGENDPAFAAGTLSAFKYASLNQVSYELLQDTGVDLLGYLGMALGRAISIGAGAAYIKGTGSTQPTGILTGGTATLAVTQGGTGVSGVPTYANLETVYDSIIPPYQAAPAEWVMGQQTVAKIRQITDTLGRPLWVPSLSGDMPDQLLGHNFFIDSTAGMPSVGTSATCIAFGDWAAYFVRIVEGIRFERSNEYAFANDLVTFRCIMRTDGLLLDANSHGVYVGGTA